MPVPEEWWVDVVDYNGLYEVSTHGRVKSLERLSELDNRGVRRRLKSKILVGYTSKEQCYPLVTLYKGKEAKKAYVHILVLTAFVGPCPIGMECRHLDRDTLNCRLSNLCWGTPSENKQDQVRHGTYRSPPVFYGENHWNAKLNMEKAKQIRELYRTGRYSSRKLAWMFNVDQKTILGIIHNRSWT